MVTDPAGGLYLTAASRGDGLDYATLKYDGQCAEQWAIRYRGPGPGAPTYGNADEPHAIAVDAAGSVYVAGVSPGADGVGDVATVKYRPAQPSAIADLVVSWLDGPAQARPGRSVQITETTANVGGAATGVATETAFFWSSDMNLDPADLRLAGRSVADLAPGASSGPVTTAAVVPSAAVGTQYLLAVADAGRVATEAFETNNVRALRVECLPGADLVVSRLRLPAEVKRGRRVRLEETTRNAGSAPVPVATVTRYYLSADVHHDARDVPIGQRTVPPLGAGASSGPSGTTLTVPPDAPPGVYVVVAVADDGAAVAEASESNNLRFARVRVVR